MPPPATPEDARKCAAIEDNIMSRLRFLYRSMNTVSDIVGEHRDLLRRCGSPLADERTACPSIDEARAIVEEIARCIHAFRVVGAVPTDEDDEVFMRYMEDIERAKDEWRP